MDGTMANITIFAGDFAPRNWAMCNGALLAISTNQALFSLLGTTYGGNGIQTFALPDLRGRAALGTGNGPGLTPVILGQVTGTENNTMIITQMPNHTHTVAVTAKLPVNNTADPDSDSPEDSVYGKAPENIYNAATSTNAFMGAMNASGVIGVNGSNQPINNMMPGLALTHIICIAGIYPTRD
ncbi:phage tail protein [Taibaiella chishuiensis]|uniref:Microcystin-dependent protein n=1 Tax=Taibaiella chishuiensis TaxID=1434707 RepID=A0A2P8D2J1_9BACT|nr:tail fiber protein [Taibaiella chishuiensis]PSK91421.1 microcystin-dependent protein [Taibaiella chishuiensis]